MARAPTAATRTLAMSEISELTAWSCTRSTLCDCISSYTLIVDSLLSAPEVVSLNDISVFAMRWRPCANPHFSGDSGTDEDAKVDSAPQANAANAAFVKPAPAPVARLEARRELMLFKRSSCAALRTQLRYAGFAMNMHFRSKTNLGIRIGFQ